MDALSPQGAVYQAGTLSGNPVATAAGLAALELLDDTAYDRLGEYARRLTDGLAKAFASAGVDAQVTRYASLVGVFFGTTAPVDYDGAKRTDEVRYSRFFHALLDRGVAIAPGAYEVLFPGLAHRPDVIDRVIDAAHEAAVVAAAQ
jgi:glutamate-1-semialdehyde 2,1-aminomutase